ncbi:hypothetical protein H4S02_003025, partial [Coemansia sp. RSA 2611]
MLSARAFVARSAGSAAAAGRVRQLHRLAAGSAVAQAVGRAQAAGKAQAINKPGLYVGQRSFSAARAHYSAKNAAVAAA